MTKITLQDPAGFTQSALDLIAANNLEIETKSDTFLSRTGVTPNSMSADLDMNSQRIINLPAPSTATEPLRLSELNDLLADGELSFDLAGTAATTTFTPTGTIAATNVQNAVAEVSGDVTALTSTVSTLSSLVTTIETLVNTLNIVTANRTYYVRTDGSDSNTGLTDSAGGAFLTWQKAANVLATLTIPSGISVTIQAGGSGARTFSTTGAPVLTVNPWTGPGSVSFIGDTVSGTPNVTFSSTSADAIRIASSSGTNFPGQLTFNGIKVTTTTSGYGFNNQGGAHVNISNKMEFGASASGHLAVTWRTATLHASGFIISGGGPRAIECDNGNIQLNSATYTVSGTPAFSGQFARVRNHGCLISDATWSGSATGSYFSIEDNANVTAGGTSLTNAFPGSTAGVFHSGSISGTVVNSGTGLFTATGIGVGSAAHGSVTGRVNVSESVRLNGTAYTNP